MYITWTTRLPVHGLFFMVDCAWLCCLIHVIGWMSRVKASFKYWSILISKVGKRSSFLLLSFLFCILISVFVLLLWWFLYFIINNKKISFFRICNQQFKWLFVLFLCLCCCTDDFFFHYSTKKLENWGRAWTPSPPRA